MPTIEIDFDVFKALTSRRPSEDVSENDILRQLLGLPTRNAPPAAPATQEAGGWVSKGVRFPENTELRATYKGRTYLARVENAALTLNGERYDSPSAAAMAITRTPVNGWTFWEARLPGRTNWQILKALRPSSGKS